MENRERERQKLKRKGERDKETKEGSQKTIYR